MFFLDGNVLARSGIATDSGVSLFNRECTETTQFNAVTVGHGRYNLFEDRIHNALHVSLVKVRIFFRDPLD
jgi:hypothetical protein